jgi:alanine dehydrogenase
MALFLNNQDQAQAITAKDAVEALESGLRQLARGDATRRPRIDNFCPTSRPDEFFCFSSMEGVVRDPGYYALRIKPDVISWPVVHGMRRRVTYNTRPGLYGGLVLLYRVDDGELLAILNDGFVQHARVAATAALGIRYLSRPGARRIGVLGSGGMARSFAHAAVVERSIEAIHVYSPNRQHVEAYCAEMSAQLSCEVIPAPDAPSAVRGADIVCCCTNAMEPVLKGEWIEPGMHITNVTGSELDAAAYARIDVVGGLGRRAPMRISGFSDDDFAMRTSVLSWAAGQPDERARIPANPPSRDHYVNARRVDCVDWETGTPYVRARDDEVTTLGNASFGTAAGEGAASAGIQGLQFATVAGRIYERAVQKRLGTTFPAELFLQDIPT